MWTSLLILTNILSLWRLLSECYYRLHDAVTHNYYYLVLRMTQTLLLSLFTQSVNQSISALLFSWPHRNWLQTLVHVYSILYTAKPCVIVVLHALRSFVLVLSSVTATWRSILIVLVVVAVCLHCTSHKRKLWLLLCMTTT